LDLYRLNSSKTFNEDAGLDLICEIEKDKPISLFSQEQTSEELGKIIMTGLVMKKCGWVFYKPRQLILKDNYTLLYYDPQTNLLKVLIE
jgi:hypothetical protein